MRRFLLFGCVGVSLGAAVVALLAFELADAAVAKLAEDLEQEGAQRDGSPFGDPDHELWKMRFA